MKETKIFLIGGKSRTGKDTVGKYIKEYYKDKLVVYISFSDYIKMYIKHITNWDGKDETKPRDLMQLIGTDIVRNKINKNFFINRICEDIEVYKYFADIIIVTGARFPDELDIPKKIFKNTYIIMVTRNKKNNLTDKQNKHITENALDNYKNYDYLIQNDNSLEELKQKTNKILEELT